MVCFYTEKKIYLGGGGGCHPKVFPVENSEINLFQLSGFEDFLIPKDSETCCMILREP